MQYLLYRLLIMIDIHCYMIHVVMKVIQFKLGTQQFHLSSLKNNR